MHFLKKSVALLAAPGLLGGCTAQMQSLPAINISANVEMRPGDIVIVPQSWF